jgi:hypothetical protein
MEMVSEEKRAQKQTPTATIIRSPTCSVAKLWLVALQRINNAHFANRLPPSNASNVHGIGMFQLEDFLENTMHNTAQRRRRVDSADLQQHRDGVDVQRCHRVARIQSRR